MAEGPRASPCAWAVHFRGQTHRRTGQPPGCGPFLARALLCRTAAVAPQRNAVLGAGSLGPSGGWGSPFPLSLCPQLAEGGAVSHLSTENSVPAFPVPGLCRQWAALMDRRSWPPVPRAVPTTQHTHVLSARGRPASSTPTGVPHLGCGEERSTPVAIQCGWEWPWARGPR